MLAEVAPTKSRIITTIGLALASFGTAGIVYRVFADVSLASTLFFPIRIYQRIRPVLRAPGYQDVMYGECLIPYCDEWSLSITVVVSGCGYYLAALALLRLVNR